MNSEHFHDVLKIITSIVRNKNSNCRVNNSLKHQHEYEFIHEHEHQNEKRTSTGTPNKTKQNKHIYHLSLEKKVVAIFSSHIIHL